jgi:glycosyltransferase involved in cell wall biosynthesis
MTSPTIAVLSTYPPTQCGLATFSAALVEQLAAMNVAVGIVRVLDEPVGDTTTSGVVAELHNGSAASAAAALEVLNSYDAVLVQHEYGIYGGPDGADVVPLLESLTVPTIVVLHTVLAEPTTQQRHILEAVVAAADVVVVMAETPRRRLVDQYGADPSRVVVIPHGAIDHRLAAPRDDNPRPVILTWGLLGPGKGIEWAIDALPALRDLNPRYLVLGKTHPKVLERHGEAYRSALGERAAALGVSDLVEMNAGYIGLADLAQIIGSADVILLPYDSPDQVTSGVLIEAVAAGRPVVATAFPHAQELLARGAGMTVPRKDAHALGAALRRVLTEPGLSAAMGEAALREAPDLVWGAVADRYRRLASDVVATKASLARSSRPGWVTAS